MDSLRGLAIWVVLVGHTLPHYFGVEIPFWAWSLGVPLFFSVSGFCISYGLFVAAKNQKIISVKNFFIKRFWRIYPPYLLCFFLFFIKILIIENLSGNSLSFFEVSKIIFFNLSFSQILMGTTTVVNPAFWSLCVEFQFYLWVAFLIAAYSKGLMYFWVTLVFSSTVLLGTHGLVITNHLKVSESTWFMALPHYAPHFLFGALMAFAKVYHTKKTVFCLIPMGIILSIIEPGGAIICALLIKGSRLFCNKEESPVLNIFERGPLVYFGERSYSIYLMHGFGILFLARQANKLLYIHPIASLFFWLTGLAFAILTSLLFYHCIEKHFLRSVSNPVLKNSK